jgi:hypothetical protein
MPGGVGEAAAASDLQEFLNGIYASEAEWRELFRSVFARWGAHTGITYVEMPRDDGAAFPGSPGALGERGDVRIGGHAIDGSYGVLAYNYFPNTGDMVIDTADSFYFDTTADSRALRNTLAHEHGHGLGLSHVCPIDESKLMEPFLSTRFDGPQHDDILGANRGYGDVNELNNVPPDGTDLGVLPVYTATNLSIDDLSDADVYRFSVGSSSQLDVTVTPLGSTYLEGPQGWDGSCSTGALFDSLSQQDLAVEVLDTDASTVLGRGDLYPAGFSEELVAIPIPEAGQYFVRVSGDSAGRAQLYTLDLAVAVDASGCDGDDPVVSGLVLGTGVDLGCTGNFGITVGADVEVQAGARLTLTAPQVRVLPPLAIASGAQLHIVTPTTVLPE